MSIKILEIKEYHDDFLHAINQLLPQLSSSAEPLTESDLKKIIESRETKLLFAQDKNQLPGILTLITLNMPTGTRAWIEDFVVDADAHGKGVGSLLMRHAMALAKESGAKTIDLTSHPSRKAANALYKKEGFKIRETNVYRYKTL